MNVKDAKLFLNSKYGSLSKPNFNVYLLSEKLKQCVISDVQKNIDGFVMITTDSIIKKGGEDND